MPYSNDIEITLLGNFTLYDDALVTAIEAGLLSSDFYVERNRLIFNTMVEMHSKGLPTDSVSIFERLKDYQLLDKVGGYDYLVSIQDAAVGNSQTEHYVDILRNKSISRKLIQLAKEIEENGYDGSKDLDEALDFAEKGILDITRNRFVTDFRDTEEAIDNVMDNVKKASTGNQVSGIKTLYRDLDYKTNGFQRGDLIILAARPSVGKTAFALNIALNIAGASSGQLGAVAIFSLEMSAEQLMARMLSARAQVPGDKIKTGKLSNDEWSALQFASTELKRSKIYIDDTPAVKVAEIAGKCRKLKAKEGLACILIDYIQLIGTNSKNSESRQQEVSEISRSLKALARELDVPLIALSQLSRSVEKREDKRPMLSDLRESGALEQDADIVMFLYREDYYNKDREERDNQEVELTLAKHRNGATGRITLSFHKNVNQFLNFATNQGER